MTRACPWEAYQSSEEEVTNASKEMVKEEL